MSAWFGSAKDGEDAGQNDATAPNGNGGQEQKQLVEVTESARQKIAELIQNAASEVLGVRILAEGTSPVNPEYSLAFVQSGEDFEDDTIIDAGDFKIYIDADSIALVENVRLDFVTSGAGGGFRIDRPKPAIQLSGPVAEKVQRVIDEQINPALSLHGGFVQLLDVKDTTVYLELGGGCRGCGMVDVTLKQGIEVMIKQHVPEVTEILDSTDHASGKNPYYQPSK